ncbi:MAG: helix-turn-helix domain-containing protein, partial [Planctomycetota bacterium]
GVQDDYAEYMGNLVGYRLRVVSSLREKLPRYHQPPQKPAESLVSIKQASDILRVHPSTLRRWIARRRLLAWKGGDRRGGNWWRIPMIFLEQAVLVTCKQCSRQFKSRVPERQCFCSDQCRTEFHSTTHPRHSS